jgi:hypothetical protein
MNLHIAKNFSLPREAITQTFAILAKRGVGKTYTASVMAEEMLKAGLSTVVIDPIGVWWGLRASANGKQEGLPIIVLGGDHGDVPLEVAAGQTIADLIIEEHLSAVLDLSLFRKGEQVRFMTDFAERLYHKNREPLHLMLDEADAWAPQRPMKGTERLLGAVEDLVRRGRARGLGMTLITQRAAVLNKNVLTQCEVLIALRTIAPQDRDAINAWIEVHGTPEQQKELMDSLPSLPIGTAWFWSPGWLDVFKQVHIRERETFDSSATPKVGKKLTPPKKLAEVDLTKLRERISATIEKAKADDPRELRRQLTEVKKQLKDSQGAVKPEVKIEKVEVPILKDSHIKRLETVIEKAAIISTEIKSIVDVARRTITENRHRLTPSIRQQPILKPKENGMDHSVSLRAGARRILAELAVRSPAGYTKAQVGGLTRFAHKAGTFGAYFGDLKKAGLIEVRSGLLYATQAGIEYLGENIPSAPTTHEEAMQLWRKALRAGAYRMLEIIVASGPNGIHQEEVASAVDMTYGAGTFSAYMGDLKRNGLITMNNGVAIANDILFP